MENMLLIGLSRQMTLERQLDVVANNVANVNTTGYKADKSLFQEFLMPGAHQDTFLGKDRRVSYVTDRATWRDYSQGAAEPTKNPLDVAIDGKGFLVVQTPGGERYTRDGNLQINAQGQRFDFHDVSEWIKVYYYLNLSDSCRFRHGPQLWKSTIDASYRNINLHR